MEAKSSSGEESMEEDFDPRAGREIPGRLMGNPLYYWTGGSIGHIYTLNKRKRYSEPSYSPLLVKQNGRDSGNMLSKEYAIANFLGNNLPSFVTAPFGFMRGFTVNDGYRYNEQQSLLQQRVHGDTFFDLSRDTFTVREFCYLFLQSNEFYLRVGDTLRMVDANPGNVMVDTRFQRMGELPHIKFIDFGFWLENFDYAFFAVMLNNMSGSIPMYSCMKFMGFTEENFNELWQTSDTSHLSLLLELPDRLKQMFLHIPEIDDTLAEEIIHSEQFRVVAKLYSIRYLQLSRSIPWGVISELVSLDLS
jgi:hypothetical protein